jgi:hypothetical protein
MGPIRLSITRDRQSDVFHLLSSFFCNFSVCLLILILWYW